jgi:hypothetical protein
VEGLGLGGGVRALVVATRGETDPSPAMWLDEATGAYHLGVEDPFRRGVWLDEATGAFHLEMIRDGEPAGGYVSVFDGSRAATRLDNRGARSVRYQGRPQVVARLAGSHAVTAAFAFVRGEPLPRGVRVRAATTPWPPDRGSPFALPAGGDFRVVREVDPITPEAVGRAYWLGAEWDGAPPLFAAVSSTSDGFVTAIVVYHGACILTSTVPAGDRLFGEPVTLADGTPAIVAHAETQPDGQFGLRWHEAGVGIHPIGYMGSELTYAGAGERGLVVVAGDDHVIVTGLGVREDTIADIAATLRRI